MVSISFHRPLGNPAALVALARQRKRQVGTESVRFSLAFTLPAYALIAVIASDAFVELTPFDALRNETRTDEGLRALQSFLLVSPEAGDLIRGRSGLRKL